MDTSETVNLKAKKKQKTTNNKQLFGRNLPTAYK